MLRDRHIQVGPFVLLGQGVGVDEGEQQLEDGRLHVVDRDAALLALAHGRVEQRAEDGRARLQQDLVNLQGEGVSESIRGAEDSVTWCSRTLSSK